ncbi:MAG TPA: amidohydrolase family protein [Longimicrobiaceae bacterium]
MIIDSHCHAGKGDGLTGPWDTDAPLGDYLRQAAEVGITRTVIFACFNSDYRAANRAVGDIVLAHPDRFWGYAFVNPARDAGRVEQMVREAVEVYGFRGIKVHRYDARITREVCEVARAFGLPVRYDVMGEVSPMELIARQYPTVTFIIPHLGSFADDWRAQVALTDLLVRHPNIYTDTSGVRRFDLLAEAVRRAGARKFLFGSDGPWLHPGVELSKVYALGLSEPDRALVTAGNLLRIIGRGRVLAEVSVPYAGVAPPQGEMRDPWVQDFFGD